MHYYTPTGLPQLDALLDGGVACGAITEVVGDRASTLRLAAAIVRDQQSRHPYAHSLWFDGAAELNADQLAALGLDPERILLITPENAEEMEQRFVGSKVAWGAFVLTGLPLDLTDNSEWVLSLKEMARILSQFPFVFLVLLTPSAVTERAARRAEVRLRLAQPVASADPGEMIVALIKHWHAPVGRTVRVVLPDGQPQVGVALDISTAG